MAWEWLKKWGQDTPRVHSFSPRSFEEAGEMATRIAEGDIVLLNVEHLEWEVARRGAGRGVPCPAGGGNAGTGAPG